MEISVQTTTNSNKQENEDEVPQRGRPMSWKQGVGLFNRQKTVELLTHDVGMRLLLVFDTIMIDPNPETWHRRLNEIRSELLALRKRLEL